jgi:ABC-2 type transport system ATP-binding protein
MISTVGLARSFDGIRAVEDLTLEIPAGKLFTLLGPNGAGKTTTVRLLLGLIAPEAGQARVAGFELGREPEMNRRIRGACGLLTETPGFYDRLTAYENLRFFARLYALPEAPLEARLNHYLRLMDLWERRDDRVATFSKGMKQKLALIRAFFHDPQVIFLDEPTSGLDPEAALMVRELIARLKSEGRTILLCTHNLDEAARLADYVGILKRRLLVCGTLGELQQRAGEATTVEIELAREPGAIEAVLRAQPSVRQVLIEGRRVHLEVLNASRNLPAIVAALVERGAAVYAVRPQAPSLESIYLAAVNEDGGKP